MTNNKIAQFTHKSLNQKWRSLSFRTKLSILLVSGAVLPTILATQGILIVAERSLLRSQQDSLQKDLVNLQHHVEEVEKHYQEMAQALQKSVELVGIDFSEPTAVTSKQDLLQKIIAEPIDTELKPSFYVITDTQGRTIAQNIQIISELSDRLPIKNAVPAVPNYQKVSVPIGIDFSELTIVKNALNHQRSLSGTELISSNLIQNLGIAAQADIGQIPQKTENLPESKIPFPAGTYKIDDGRIGLGIIAVQPIKKNDQIVALAIVGNLLNRNYQLVDSVTHTSRVSTATLFAYDWRVTTNVPTYDGQKRAIGTRVAREVATCVLDQGRMFVGSTNIVGQTYRTTYAPIYDHRRDLNLAEAQPIGIYYVGDPETKIQQTLTTLAMTGYSIGGGILCLAVIIVLPIASTFSDSIRRLTNFAQLIGRGEQGIRLEENQSQDEIGILGRELNKMAIRIESNLDQVIAKELQIRQQAQQLEEALKQLQQTQMQLVENAKMSSLEMLVAGLAHEINNPVTFIYSNVKYAQQYIDDLIKLMQVYQNNDHDYVSQIENIKEEIDWEFLETDLPHLLQSMKTGAERIQRIVQMLRIFSRMDEAEYKSVNLHDGLDSILELLQYRLQSTENHPAIEVIKEYGQIPLIECYAGQINQVFLNIISNAIDALKATCEFSDLAVDSPNIRIRTKQIDSTQVRIHIVDNGLGMSENVKERIFEPFFTTKPVGQGTGMGLAISYQIVTQRHGGMLECISTPGKGTEFVITIPLQAG
ncbi:MAG: cache domain-containing protein [Gloeotrichia echinulata IR180]|jgi:signal transduction histidine kinase|nr:cache domain-containing protein [Gloeotrichia echinulata DEX184]